MEDNVPLDFMLMRSQIRCESAEELRRREDSSPSRSFTPIPIEKPNAVSGINGLWAGVAPIVLAIIIVMLNATPELVELPAEMYSGASFGIRHTERQATCLEYGWPFNFVRQETVGGVTKSSPGSIVAVSVCDKRDNLAIPHLRRMEEFARDN